MPKTFFLSYDRADSLEANRLRQELEEAGFAIWQDDSPVQGTEAWRDQLRATLQRADGVLVLLSPTAVSSEFVTQVWAIALEQAQLLFPLLIYPCTLPAPLAKLHCHNLSQPQTYPLKLVALIRDLDRLPEKPAPQGDRSLPAASPPDRAETPALIAPLPDSELLTPSLFQASSPAALPSASTAAVILTLPTLERWQPRPEEAQLKDWLTDPARTTIGLQGVGGSGKSWLAARLYSEDLGFVKQGWLDVSQQPSFSVFAEQVYRIFREDLPADFQRQPIAAQIDVLLQYLSFGRCLVVVDGLEALLDSPNQWRDAGYEQFFQRWHRQGQTSTVLVTTQERPGLLAQSEIWLPVAGLDDREGGGLLQRWAIRGTPAELEACSHRVSGHPLTLRLVIGFLREYCNSELGQHGTSLWGQLEQMQSSFAEPLSNWQTTCLDWVIYQHWEKLPRERQRFLIHLSVYRQPFHPFAAAWMLDPDRAASDPQVLQQASKAVRELASAGLVRATQDGRYQVPPPVQQSALQQAADLTAAHASAILYYASVALPPPWKELEDVRPYLEIVHHFCELGQYGRALEAIGNCDEFLARSGYTAIRFALYDRLVRAWQPIATEKAEFEVAVAQLERLQPQRVAQPLLQPSRPGDMAAITRPAASVPVAQPGSVGRQRARRWSWRSIVDAILRWLHRLFRRF